MGCRYAQSNSFHDCITSIYEPSNDIYEQNLNLIGQASNKNIIKLSSLNEAKLKYDFCVTYIISTKISDFRDSLNIMIFQIFLLKKLSFRQTLNLINQKLIGNKNNVCKFCKPYFENYIDIKKKLITYHLQWMLLEILGLGCNALHYFDLFKYFGAMILN